MRVQVQLLQGHFEQTRHLAEALLARNDTPAVRQYLALAVFYTGDAARAKQDLAGIRRRDGRPDTRSQASLAGVLAATGTKDEAAHTIKGVIDSGCMDHHVPYSLGAAEAQLGHPADAMKWLRQASDTGFPCHPWFARDPLLDPIRAHPEFVAFLGELRVKLEATLARYRSPA